MRECNKLKLYVSYTKKILIPEKNIEIQYISRIFPYTKRSEEIEIENVIFNYEYV